MRWDEVFADLQAQLQSEEAAEAQARIAELAETELAGTSLSDRWRGCIGAQLRLRLLDGSDREGEVADAAGQWLVLARGRRRSLVPRHAVAWASGLGGSAPEAGVVERGITLGHVLRAFAQEQLPVVLHTMAGSTQGRLVRVGGDHLDLAGAAEQISVPYPALLSVEST